MLIQHSGSLAGGHREGIDSQHQKRGRGNTPSLALKKQDQAQMREKKVGDTDALISSPIFLFKEVIHMQPILVRRVGKYQP